MIEKVLTVAFHEPADRENRYCQHPETNPISWAFNLHSPEGGIGPRERDIGLRPWYQVFVRTYNMHEIGPRLDNLLP